MARVDASGRAQLRMAHDDHAAPAGIESVNEAIPRQVVVAMVATGGSAVINHGTVTSRQLLLLWVPERMLKQGGDWRNEGVRLAPVVGIVVPGTADRAVNGIVRSGSRGECGRRGRGRD